MNYFSVGQFFGDTHQTVSFAGITATETEYNYQLVDWHYHENSYFSFVTQGHCRHINKREAFDCSPGSLLFHNCHEPHYNTKSSGLSRGFQIELSHDWCKKFEVDLDMFPSSVRITSPNAKLLFYNIYKESKLPDNTSNLTIDALLIETFETIRGVEKFSTPGTPRWVKKIDEILHENFNRTLSLQKVSEELDLHFVHLSRDFPRYFRCNFSQYVRKIKIEKSLGLLRNQKLSMIDIAFACGFADQSHFIRCFKEFIGLTPKDFRRLLR
jgi:AraC family transcriptional regulator